MAKKMLLYGKNSIKERLKVNPGSITKIFLKEKFNVPEINLLIKQNNIPCQYKTENELKRTKRADRLQGIIAEINPFEYTPIDDLICEPDDKKLAIICLDGLNDPQNLGSILRITACFGGFALVIPKHQSCEVNETVLHVASGGENYVPVAQVSNLANTLKKIKQHGYWVAGSAVNAKDVLKEGLLPSPICLILGSEGKGMSPGLEKYLDMNITIPMHGAPLSFNVAMACGIFCYEIEKERIQKSGDRRQK